MALRSTVHERYADTPMSTLLVGTGCMNACSTRSLGTRSWPIHYATSGSTWRVDLGRSVGVIVGAELLVIPMLPQALGCRNHVDYDASWTMMRVVT